MSSWDFSPKMTPVGTAPFLYGGRDFSRFFHVVQIDIVDSFGKPDIKHTSQLLVMNFVAEF